jgi:F-type H+-transporting ATPase subunit b
MNARARCATLAAWLIFGAAWVTAQEPPAKSQAAAAKEGAGEGPSPVWAWANFAILVGALGYFAVKKGGPWFVSRSQEIRKGIAQAEQIRAEAEARAREVDRKFAGLQTEIEALRADAHREQAAEAERIRRQNAADLARIQEHGASEIEAAGKAARLELKRYAAQLAIDLAEQKIRRQMTVEVQTALVENFSRNLDQPSAGSHLNK